MVPSDGLPAGSLSPSPAFWRLSRLSLDYLLDSIEISRAGSDVVDRLLLAAVLDANVAPIKQDADLQHAYAELDAAPPEALRRPVSVNALAQSLGLPFETVRRRAARLVREGACVATARGLIVPQAVLESPAMKAVGLARYQRLRQFHADLVAAQALPPIRAAAEPLAPTPVLGAGEPVRIANRVLAEYLMRFVEGVMRRLGDPLTSLILLHIARANTEHLDLVGSGAAIPPAEAERRPVSIARLAAILNVPAETVRRRVAWLDKEGFVRRTGQGSVIRADAAARPGVLSLIGENAANVQRLFVQLGRLGVLDAWARDAPAAPRRKEGSR